MAKSVDAPGLGPDARNGVSVRIRLGPPLNNNKKMSPDDFIGLTRLQVLDLSGFVMSYFPVSGNIEVEAKPPLFSKLCLIFKNGVVDSVRREQCK